MFPGSITLVYGSVNSGKTTLLNEISGIQTEFRILDANKSSQIFKPNPKPVTKSKFPYKNGDLVGFSAKDVVNFVNVAVAPLHDEIKQMKAETTGYRIESIDDRLSIANPSNRYLNDHPHSKLFDLEKERLKLINKLNSVSRKVFGENILFDEQSREVFSFYCVSRKKMISRNQDQDIEKYDSILHNNQLMQDYKDIAVPLQKVGSGQKAFMMCLLHLLLPNDRKIICIDEPDAFLHPSLHEQLAEELISNRPKDSYLILSTHSPNFLRRIVRMKEEGIGDLVDLTLLKMSGEEGDIPVRILDDQDVITEIAGNPLLLKNMIDGCFSKEVIVCESESDCSFYIDASVKGGLKDNAYKFTWCGAGGKQNIWKHVHVLEKLHVKWRVVADFDFILFDNDKLDAVASAFVTNAVPDAKELSDLLTDLKKDVDGIDKEEWKVFREYLKGKGLSEDSSKIEFCISTPRKDKISQDREEFQKKLENAATKSETYEDLAKALSKILLKFEDSKIEKMEDKSEELLVNLKKNLENVVKGFENKYVFVVPCGALEGWSTIPGQRKNEVKWKDSHQEELKKFLKSVLEDRSVET